MAPRPLVDSKMIGNVYKTTTSGQNKCLPKKSRFCNLHLTSFTHCFLEVSIHATWSKIWLFSQHALTFSCINCKRGTAFHIHFFIEQTAQVHWGKWRTAKAGRI